MRSNGTPSCSTSHNVFTNPSFNTMSLSELRMRLKPWMLPIAMFLGIVLHNYIGYVAFLSKYIIFVMLLITYTRIKISDFHIGGYVWWLLAVQIFGAIGAYLIIKPFNELIAQGVFICIICPTATAAPVITSMLGGSISKVATYSLFSNVAVAFLAPLLLSWLGQEGGTHNTATFAVSLYEISLTVLPMILGPLVVAFMMERYAPKAHKAISTHQGLSFYIWAFALIIVVGNSVSFLLKEPASMIPVIILLAIASMLACIAQFAAGRVIGGRYGDKISGAQSLGQKNTVLAIWLALSYLNPIASIAPAAYVAWHNTINSWQIYRHEKDRASQHRQ